MTEYGNYENNMYYKQKSCLPVLISLSAASLPFCCISFWIYTFVTAYANGLLQYIQWDQMTVGWFLSRILPFLIFLLTLIYISLIGISLFPDIAIAQSGIRFKSPLSKGEVGWEEIGELKHLRWLEGYLIVIKREGASYIHPKGLTLNFIQGCLLGCFSPILLITQGLRNFDEIQIKIQEVLAKHS